VPHNVRRYDHLVGFALEHPWAITPAMRAVIAGVLARRIAGMDDDEDGIALAAEMRAMRQHPAAGGGNVAVIPISGVIAPKMNALTEISGGTTFDLLGAHLRQAVADSTIRAIVFDVDSPGGNVAGATEFAREVLRARTIKPVFAQANHLMASAAYWPMSCATEVIATPSALVGAIGVYHIYNDISGALEQMGVKRQVFSAGKYKAEGVDGGPLSAEAQAHVQSLIDGAYGRFVGDVGKGRGVAAADVRKGFGEGRAVAAEDAVSCNLIDRIGTLEETLARACEPPTGGRAFVALSAPPPATPQEPAPPATGQEPAAVRSASLLEFERRVLDLRLKGLGT